MTPRMLSLRRNQVVFSCVVGAWLAAACGGRFRTINDVDDDAPSAGQSSAGAAGSARAGAAQGGAVSAGASSGGGAPGAGAPSAGAPAGGGCGTTACPLFKCAPGYRGVVPPGKCCPVCQLDCNTVMCPAVGCPAGSHTEVPAGQCCPVCVDDAGYACTQGKAQYAEQRVQYLDKYSYGCNSDSECVVVAPTNLCEPGCGYAAVWMGAAGYFNDNLNNLASMICSTCNMEPSGPCAMPLAPQCFNHQCEFAHPI